MTPEVAGIHDGRTMAPAGAEMFAPGGILTLMAMRRALPLVGM